MVTMMARESDVPEDFLLQDFLALDTPDGYRAELIDGEIVVTPPPDGNHESIIDLIIKQVYRKSSVDMSFAANKGLSVPSHRGEVGSRVIPDGTFAPSESQLFRDAPPWMSPEGVAMVVEVTSSRPETDREDKRHVYAAAAIPLYLLVDRQRVRVSLFSEPAGDDYARALSAPFGGDVELPKPFAFTLSTSEFAA
jgi:Uma2 family endonuclease